MSKKIKSNLKSLASAGIILLVAAVIISLSILGLALVPLVMIALPLICIVVSLTLFVKTAIKSHKEKDSYAKSIIWRNKVKILGISSFFAFALGFGCGELFSVNIAVLIFFSASVGTLVPFLLAYAFYRLWRVKWRRCPQCGARMKRLNEWQDNKYLSASQNYEERIGSVDYDVWLCSKCGKTDIFSFVSKKTKYKKCPNCGVVAALEQSTIVYTEPTSSTPGKGVSCRVCQYCGQGHNINIDIEYNRRRH